MTRMGFVRRPRSGLPVAVACRGAVQGLEAAGNVKARPLDAHSMAPRKGSGSAGGVAVKGCSTEPRPGDSTKEELHRAAGDALPSQELHRRPYRGCRRCP